jgi:hypothetical protein
VFGTLETLETSEDSYRPNANTFTLSEVYKKWSYWKVTSKSSFYPDALLPTKQIENLVTIH